jgi:malate dehydrogenase
MPKVSIIGAGNVGATAAFCLARKKITDIVLLDRILEVAQGKSKDISDSFSSIIGTDDYSLVKDSDVIVITAGKPRTKNGEATREQLFEINSSIVKSVSEEIQKHSPNSVVLTVTNPVDKMNSIVYSILGNRSKAIGVAGLLDTFRFRNQIFKATKSKLIDALVIGPHNDKMIPLLSLAKVDSRPISEVLTADKLDLAVQKTRSRGKEIVDLMGSGYYSIGEAIATMVEHVLLDKKEIIPASVNLEGEYGISGVSIGVPVRLGKDGAEVVELEFREKTELISAAEKMK